MEEPRTVRADPHLVFGLLFPPIELLEFFSPMRVVVVGQGYVGLPVSMRAVEVGHDVVGIDTSVERVRSLSTGNSYVEDISDVHLATALASGRFRATSDYEAAEGFDIAVIAVPTPLRESLPDLTYIESSANALSKYLIRGATVILESTTYPGTTEEMVGPILESGSGLIAGKDFYLGYSPERIDPGNKTWGFVETPKIVSGLNEASLERVSEFYRTLVREVVPVSGLREAELAKLLENTFRHVNIALVNELAVFAHQLGVNIWESIGAASTKPFGFMPFWPGPGVGGHCLPVDPSYLSWQVKRQLGQTFRFVELANDVNEHMPRYVAQRIAATLNRQGRAVNGSRILVVGIAYKKNTGDVRESPSLRLVTLLQEDGAIVSALDSHVPDLNWPAGVVRRIQVAPASADIDLIVVLTDHDDIDFDGLIDLKVPILDTRNRLTGELVEHL